MPHRVKIYDRYGKHVGDAYTKTEAELNADFIDGVFDAIFGLIALPFRLAWFILSLIWKLFDPHHRLAESRPLGKWSMWFVIGASAMIFGWLVLVQYGNAILLLIGAGVTGRSLFKMLRRS